MKRGKKIIVVAHCFLNQNARVLPYASRSGSVIDVIQPFLENGFGIIQLPCPETTACGLKRWEAVTEQYDNPGFRRHCRKIIQPYVDQLSEHQKVGDKIYGVIGVPFSPCCGTQNNPSNKKWGGPVINKKIQNLKIIKGPAVFMQELMKMCLESKIKIKFYDISELPDMFPEIQPNIVIKKIIQSKAQ